MFENLDSYITAYGDNFDHAFDNEIMLNWYPRRIMALSNQNNRVLELGIGHGYTCNCFSDYYAQYSVIEGSRAIIEKFKQQYPNSKARIIQSFFENFDMDQTFDIIIMGFVLEHVDNPTQILNHFRKFIAPDGRIFISVPNAESLHRRFGHEAGLLPNMLALSISDQQLGHQRSYTADSMNLQLKSCGYRILHQEGIFLKPFTTNQIKSLNLSKEILESMCKVGIHYPELSAGLLFETKVSV